MYNAASIKTGLYQLVGWRQPTNTDLPTLDSDNLTSNSGLIFQDFHDLIKIDYIYNCQSDSGISDANFNTFLDNMQKACIIDVINKVFQVPDLLENGVLYPYENVVTDTLDNDTSFVGYEIYARNRKDLAVLINQVITEFDAVDSLKLLLFHSSKQALVDSETITLESLTSTVTNLGWNLDWNTYKGGKWYIGYLRSGLTAKALNREYDMSNIDTCFGNFRIRPIKVASWNSETLFDIDDIEYESDTYGLNFDISSKMDYTDLILRNKEHFATAIGLQMAVRTASLIITSNRSNINERMSEVAFAELNQKEENIQGGGIKAMYDNEIKTLKEMFFKKPKIRKYTLG